jgi:RPA family protein
MIRTTKREVARRVFSKEFNASKFKVGGEGEKEAVYVLTPLGLRCNRLFIVGVLLEKDEVRPDSDMWRIRISDPTGSFLGFVSKFQPDALDSIADINPPEIVAVTAKAKLLQRDDRVLPLIRPENINISDFETRDYWIIETARATLRRIKAIEKGDDKLAIEKYHPNIEEYRKAVIEALMRLKEEQAILEEERLEEKKERKEEEEKDLGFKLNEEIIDLSDFEI